MANTVVFQDDNKKQAQFIEAVLSGKYSTLLFGGAIRGGKTFVALAIALLLCRIYPKSRWTIVRKDLKRLKDNTRPSLNKFIEGANVKINESAQTFTMPNGSVILFKGENYDKDKTLESFKGHETNGFILEEVSETRLETYHKCVERAGSYVIVPEPAAGQPSPLIIMTCNPTQTWVKQLIYDPFKKGELPSHIYYLASFVTDNPHLPQKYVDNLKNLPIYEYEVFVLGNWDITLKTKNAFWYAFEAGEHIGLAEHDPETTLHVSIDSNNMPYCTATFWQIYPDEKRVCQVGEICARDPRNHAAGLAQEVISYLEDLEYDNILYIYGDATTQAQNTIDERKRSFYDIFTEELSSSINFVSNIGRSNPQIALTGEFVNALYQGFGGWNILINETCKESLSDYMSVKKAEDGTMMKNRVKDAEGNSYEEYGHVSDTKRYFFYEALPGAYSEWNNRFSTPPEAVIIEIEDNF